MTHMTYTYTIKKVRPKDHQQLNLTQFQSKSVSKKVYFNAFACDVRAQSERNSFAGFRKQKKKEKRMRILTQLQAQKLTHKSEK